MNQLTPRIIRYVAETLGERLTLRQWDGNEHLPLFLRERYLIFDTKLFEVPLLFMVAQMQKEETPANVRKHMALLQEKSVYPCIYVREHITTYNRKRLIEHRVPFIIPGRQMYLPLLGLDLRERFGTVKPKLSVLSPSTQAILIHLLLHFDEGQKLTAAQLRPRLHYSPITMSRAFDELEVAELIKSSLDGRKRILCLADTKKTIWKKSQRMMRNPVKSLYHIRDNTHGLQSLVAGLSALALRSMLAEPSNPVVAISGKDWRAACGQGSIESIPMRDKGTMDIEVWAYSPHILSEDEIVDPLSLYLSLRDTADERVDAALDEMLEHMQW